jgi:hypothetical protein
VFLSMIHIVLSFVLSVSVTAEQPQNATSKADSGPSVSSSQARLPESIDPEAPVITVHGICKDGSQKAADSQDCKTMVSKRQFERLMATFAGSGQPVPVNARRQLAQAYVDLLAYEQAARASGTASSPEFQDLMDLVRLRTLADVYRRSVQARYGTPSQQDIHDYYQQNLQEFIELKLRRVMVPRRNPAVGNQEEYEKRALQVAGNLWERASKGEDLNQLQQEGYAALGLASPPVTDLGIRRKENLVPDIRDEILALDAGGVSKLAHEAYSFVIYKVEGKRTLPEAAVHDEIGREISRQRLDNALKQVTSGILSEFNQEYFPSAPSGPANPPASSPKAPPQPATQTHR